MKKISLLLSIIAAMCFTACGNSSSTADNDSSKVETTTTAETTTTTQPTTTTSQTTTTTVETTTTTEQTEPEIKKPEHFVDSYLYVFKPNNGQVDFLFGTRNISGKPATKYEITISLWKANGEPANVTNTDGLSGNAFGLTFEVGSGARTPYTIAERYYNGLNCTTYEKITVNEVKVTFEDGSTEDFDPQLSSNINTSITYEQAWDEINKKYPAYFNDEFVMNPDGSYSFRYKWMEQNAT